MDYSTNNLLGLIVHQQFGYSNRKVLKYHLDFWSVILLKCLSKMHTFSFVIINL